MDQLHLFKTRDPLAGSAYEKVYQDLKNISKNGENFCKTLMSVLQQRASLELSYAKGLEKVSSKLTKSLEGMNKNVLQVNVFIFYQVPCIVLRDGFLRTLLCRRASIYCINVVFGSNLFYYSKIIMLIVFQTSLKINLLEANYFKLSLTLAELQQQSPPTHLCSERMVKWKEKGCQHCSVQVSRSINSSKLRRTSTRRISSRSSGYSNSSTRNYAMESDEMDFPSKPPRGLTKRSSKNQRGSMREHGDMDTGENVSCQVLYPYEPQRNDELGLQKGDLVIIHKKSDDGWWYGTLNGKKGYFPSTYVEDPDNQYSES
ncbi:nostrin [Pyxicephalus adspersus]|uniref:nostrin n=1 Tax=Pyxicephalus adspersus TaxID=30357 RepID=UPI003B5B2257